MLIQRQQTLLPGCLELQPQVAHDSRGAFVETFNSDAFAALGLPCCWAEQYYSVSKRGVLRGLHFQLPPFEHGKLVYCIAGEVLDVAVDFRKGSPAFGKHVCVLLHADKANMVYLPAGLAHGFYTLSSTATLVYSTTSVYSPQHDSGIRWHSASIKWPEGKPELSQRDRGLIGFDAFESPFTYSKSNEAAR